MAFLVRSKGELGPQLVPEGSDIAAMLSAEMPGRMGKFSNRCLLPACLQA